MNVTETMGERINHLRKDNNLNQTEFGKLFGVKHNLVSAWENDKRLPSTEVLKEMSQRFNCSYYWLFTGNDDRNHVVCEELGLASKTVDELRAWNNIDKSKAGRIYAQGVIDILVAYPELLYAIGNYFYNDFDSMMFCDFSKEKKQPVFLHLSDDTNITPDDYERMTRLRLLDGLKAVRNELKGGKTDETGKR